MHLKARFRKQTTKFGAVKVFTGMYLDRPSMELERLMKPWTKTDHIYTVREKALCKGLKIAPKHSYSIDVLQPDGTVKTMLRVDVLAELHTIYNPKPEETEV